MLTRSPSQPQTISPRGALLTILMAEGGKNMLAEASGVGPLHLQNNRYAVQHEWNEWN